MDLFLALVPILSIFLFLVFLQWPARRAMPLTFILTSVTALVRWRMPPAWWGGSIIEGLVTTAEVLYIIFNALLLLRILQRSGALERIKEVFLRLNPDRRIQAIIVGWAFGGFIEGASGFGTPAAVVGPLLLSLGFPVTAAVMTGLFIQSTAVSFGAVGTPILIGVSTGLAHPTVSGYLQGLGMEHAEYIRMIGGKVAIYHGVIGLFMPLLLSIMLTTFFGPKKNPREGLKIWRFALLAGVSFCLPYALAANFLGLEFPSLAGGLVCLPVLIFAARRRWFQPEKYWDFQTEPGGKEKEKKKNRSLPILLAWAPYLLLTVFLVLSRFPGLPFSSWLQNFSFTWKRVLGTTITVTSRPLYLPGTMLLLTVTATIFLHRVRGHELKAAFFQCARDLRDPLITLAFVIPLVRIFINSGNNPLGLSSMPLLLAETAARSLGRGWPFFAPVTGALGAFIAGSNTFSNMMFSLFQFGIARRISAEPAVIVALQAVGGAAGNLISIHNVVAASAVAGLAGKEGILIRRELLPLIYYLLFAGILGLFLTMF